MKEKSNAEKGWVDPDVLIFAPGDLTNEVWRGYDTGEPASFGGSGISVATDGTYYVKVDCYENNSDPNVPYSITITVTP